MATADGSLRTTPRSGATMSVLTVPRSIAKSSVKILLRMFIAPPLVLTASLMDVIRRGQLRLGKWRSTKTETDIRRFSKNGPPPRVSFSDDTGDNTHRGRAEGERKQNE